MNSGLSPSTARRVTSRLAVGDRRRLRATSAAAKRQAQGVDGGAVGREAGVVPDRRSVAAGCGAVDIVTQELGGEAVLTRAARVAGSSAVDFGEGARRASMEKDADQDPGS